MRLCLAGGFKLNEDPDAEKDKDPSEGSKGKRGNEANDSDYSDGEFVHQHFENSDEDDKDGTINFFLVDEATPEDGGASSGPKDLQEPLSYESRLKQITSTKFKGDIQTSPQAGTPAKQAAIGDTREFECIESEIIDEAIKENEGEGVTQYNKF